MMANVNGSSQRQAMTNSANQMLRYLSQVRKPQNPVNLSIEWSKLSINEQGERVTSDDKYSGRCGKLSFDDECNRGKQQSAVGRQPLSSIWRQ
jgi:hypothetical protein